MPKIEVNGNLKKAPKSLQISPLIIKTIVPLPMLLLIKVSLHALKKVMLRVFTKQKKCDIICQQGEKYGRASIYYTH